MWHCHSSNLPFSEKGTRLDLPAQHAALVLTIYLKDAPQWRSRNIQAGCYASGKEKNKSSPPLPAAFGFYMKPHDPNLEVKQKPSEEADPWESLGVLDTVRKVSSITGHVAAYIGGMTAEGTLLRVC